MPRVGVEENAVFDNVVPLIGTVSSIARVRPTQTIRRTRLLDRAEALLQPFVVVRAPPGYGKSVFLSQWFGLVEQRGERVAWLASGDFVGSEGLVAQRLSDVLGLHFDIPTSRQDSAVLSEWLGSVNRLDPKITLFLDDLHCLDKRGEAYLRKLLELRWPSLRLVLASRNLPKLGLARLQVNAQLAEFGAADLRFDGEELARFLAARSSVMDPAFRTQVEALTEGWPAALTLLVPLLKKSLASRKALISNLTRLDGTFGEYVREEILGNLNEDARNFALEAGTIGRFTIELLGDLLSMDDAASRIDSLMDQGAFLRADHGHGDWYAFHPLVAAVLESMLQRERPSRFIELHVKAATWHKAYGKLGDAISHAFAARDVDLAADLLALAGSTLERIGRWRTFTSWTSRLPAHLLDRYPAIHIEAACAHGVLYEFELARDHADAARSRSAELCERDRDDLLLADAIIATFSDQPEGAFAAGDRGLRECMVREPYTIGCMWIASAVGWIGRNDVAKARQSLLEAHAITREGGSPFGTIMSLALRGLTHAIEGDLNRAVEIWNEGESIVSSLETGPAIVAVASGYQPLALYERNDLSGAEETLAASFAGSVEIAFPDMVASLYLIASRTAYARGDHGKVALLLDEAEVTGLQRAWPRLVQVAVWERVRFALRSGSIDEARRLHARINVVARSSAPSAIDAEGDLLAQLEYEAATNPGRELLTRLRTATSQALHQSRRWRAVRLLLIEAKAREASQDHFGALRAVRRAVELAAPGRLVRTFVDAGDTVVRLVQTIEAEEGRAPSALSRDFLQEILTAGSVISLERRVAEDPTDALSARELDVLKMLAAGLSNRELAARLFVTENTVKWHLQHIFAKLGVRNRTRAVVVAREGGIISD